MASTIVTKNSSTASAVPVSGDLTQGELAVNVTDKRLFTKNSGGTVVELGTNPASLALPNGTANGVAYLNGSKVVTTGSALTFDGTNLGIGTSSPVSRLDVRAASAVIGNYQQIQAFSTDTAAINLGGGISLGGYYSGVAGLASFGTIVGRKENGTDGNYAGYLAFGTNAQATGVVERMRLDSSGNLGLGVTPSAWETSAALQVVNGYAYTKYGMSRNTYYDGANYRYITTAPAANYQMSSGAHVWQTAASGTAGNAITFTQAMTLDASGNLGVGTTSPAKRLQSTDSNGDVLRLQRSGAFTGLWDIKIGATATGDFTIVAAENSANALVIEKGSGINNAVRITSSGNLLVGTTTALAGARFESSSSGINHTFYRANATGGNTLGLWLSDRYSTAGTVAYFRVDGGLANYSANNVNLSDARVKTDIKDAESYLYKICSIPVRTFKYKNVENAEDNLGVIAQEVEAVAPELVSNEGFGETPEDGIPLKAIYQTDLQYALMKCIQEQQAIIEQLKADVAALKGN